MIKKNQILFTITLLLCLGMIGCGKKSALEYPGERPKPVFDNISDEM